MGQDGWESPILWVFGSERSETNSSLEDNVIRSSR